MFEKNLQDLVKGIRSAKGDVTVFISQAMQDIKTELKSTDPFLKAEAVRKLTYLHMLGYDMTWAAFHVVEVMSYERFAHKRIGYTAASQSFTQSTDVVLLCTNLLKKEFGAVNEYEVGLAINVLANIATTDLARDLLGDVVAMMNSPKAYVRKKATLVLYKAFLRYPQGLRLTFDKLKERMEEPDVSVVSCAVNVICELANKKPKNYLGLAPQFFRLLTTSSNNWMLIKVVKLMASLVPEEPRLARKLLDPLATIIQNTPAKSLLYECISTVTTALLYTKKGDGSQPRNVAAVVRLCNDHLRRFIEDTDQNLRYLGLVGLSRLMESHPFVIGEHQQLIIECLAVDDMTIRMRSLELLVGMVTPDNAAQIIRELMRQTLSADGHYRHELIKRILLVCSVNKYENIHDFDWYIHVLVQLARVPSSNTAFSLDPANAGSAGLKSSIYDDDPAAKSHGIEVARQLIDIAVRVKSVRSVMVDNMIDLLLEKDALSGPGASTLCEVYYAAAWITGEYVTEYLDDTDENDEDDEEEDEDEEKETEEEKLEHIHDLVDEMLQPRTTSLPAHVQTVYIQTLLKFVTAMADRADDATLEKLAELVLERLPAFVQSEHVEVQERAVSLQQILLSLGLGYGSLSADARASRAFDSSISLDASARVGILSSYFAERLAPVGAKAQRKVPMPGDLDLDVAFSASETSFLESGGDFASFSNEDDLEVSFVQHQQSANTFSGGYNNIGFQDSPAKKKKKSSRHRREADSDGSDSNDSDSDDAAEREKEQERERERLRKDPFYLSGANKSNTNDLLGGGVRWLCWSGWMTCVLTMVVGDFVNTRALPTLWMRSTCRVRSPRRAPRSRASRSLLSRTMSCPTVPARAKRTADDPARSVARRCVGNVPLVLAALGIQVLTRT
jgi:AP-3 complex subunit delta